MGKAIIDEETLTGIADAIRAKKGTSGLIPTPNMRSEILSISGGGENHREVTSIISDGASYIKTGIHPSPYYTAEIEFKLAENVYRDDFIFGTRYGSLGSWQANFDYGTADDLLVARSYSYTANRAFYRSGLTKNDFLDYRVLKVSRDKVYVDGELDGTISGGTTGYTHYPFQLYLFSVNDTDENGANPQNHCGLIDCKYFKIWNQNDELVLDLVPVVKTDGTVCMYNKVNGAYYYNAGTGTFTYTE